MISPVNPQPSNYPASSTPAPQPAQVADQAVGDTVSWTFEYDAQGLPKIHNPQLKGSFNPVTGAFDPNWNQGKGLPMRDDGQGGDRVAGDNVYTAQVPLQWKSDQRYTWGVSGDINGKTDQWLILSDDNPEVQLWAPDKRSYYAPVTNHLYGVHRGDDGSARFCTWSPKLGTGSTADYQLCVDLYDRDGKMQRSIPMERDAARGDWKLTLPSWKDLEGCSYRYTARNSKGEALKNQQGQEVSYADPVSRYLQGQQRGVERIFVEPVLGFETGWYNDSGSGGPNYADNPQWGRFTVDGYGKADSVKLVLRDENGKQLNRAQLLERLGKPEFKSYQEASDKDKADVDVLTRWTMAKTKPITDYVWLDKVSEDGSISMKKTENKHSGANWSVAVNNFPKLVGLNYEFQVRENGKLLGDRNGDSILSPQELKSTPFNDPYTNEISATPGSGRNTLIKESSFVPQFKDAPRKETDFRKFVIYELHVGSFMGSKDNALPSTMEDFMKNLDYLEKLGVNCLEMLPTAEFGGKRDWGYTPDHFFAGADAYGFEMDREEAVKRGVIRPDENVGQERIYVNGTDAVRVAVDEAHRRGFTVLGDVVYNHTSGRPDGDNPLWLVDGDNQAYFKWFDDYVSNTPWGAKPNFAAQGVKDFVTNHSVEQLDFIGFDGIRFDFTQVLHNTGTAQEQIEGMKTLRQINRTVQAVQPGAFTTAEDFSKNWLVAADLDESQWQHGIEKKGMGFQTVWTDRFRMDTFGVAERDGRFNMDSLMEALTSHVNVSGFDRAVVYAHSHDEVGNSGKWMQRGAAGSKEDNDVFKPYPRAMARSIATLNLLGAGVPMLWQGEEFMANNDFKHGLTATWGHDTDWMDYPLNPSEFQRFRELEAQGQKPAAAEAEKFKVFQETDRDAGARMADRQGQFKCYQDLISLRGSSEAFTATSEVKRLFTHNGDRVLALTRKGGGDEFVVATNFSDQDRSGYSIGLPEGRWQEVFNSDAGAYGGSNRGNAGAVLQGGAGVHLPPGGTVVLKRV